MRAAHASSAALTLALLGCDAASPCRDLARAACERELRCEPFVFHVAYPSTAACEAVAAAACERTRALPDVSVDEAGLAVCAAELGKSCSSDAPCAALSRGARADGEPCASSAQCASGVCGALEQPFTCALCEPSIPAGEPCSADAPCAPGLRCVAGLCAKPLPEGAACAPGACAGYLGCVGGVCAPRLGPGAPCTDSEACDPGAGAVCGDAGVCEAVTVAASGGACGLVEGAFVLCPPGERCGELGTCDARGAQGAPCAASAACELGLVCSEGTCGTGSVPSCP